MSSRSKFKFLLVFSHCCLTSDFQEEGGEEEEEEEEEGHSLELALGTDILIGFTTGVFN